MLRGLVQLIWLEIKIFLREPLGAIGTLAVPVVVYLLLGRTLGRRPGVEQFANTGLPVLATVLVAISTALSLTAILAIYREGGILKRLRATPLRPLTILSAHVAVKLLMAGATLALMALAGRRLAISTPPGHPWSFLLAALLATLSLLSLGFVIAAVVPTARFAQPLGSAVLYPLLSISGLFFPLDKLPPAWRSVALASPVTHAVALLEGLWSGGSWRDEWSHALALVIALVVCAALSSKIFRWE